MIPAKPVAFHPKAAPPGVEYLHVEFARPKLKSPARLILIHTNAAQREGTLQSAWNWAHAAPNSNTCPTYQVDLNGRARKMLSSDEDAIANCTRNDVEDGHGDVSEWSLAIETADTGTLDDPGISAFTDAQVETISQIVAYESILWNIPIVTPTEWYGAGVAGHTDPFPYPYWTCFNGKICPGSKKKAQIRNVILPRATEIATAWRAPPEEEDMPLSVDDLNRIREIVAGEVAKVPTAVWQTKLNVSSTEALNTGSVLGQARNYAKAAAEKTAGGTGASAAEVAEAVADELSGRLDG